ncbi:X-linked retinitis pigmentosa GTPase regulator-like [Pieris rapae]|uniref:X-linked retinitis pigmentosa GTPase regulator-like n=1 Tax=Pieris rapae TaxID=64459 RepID=UPI001E27C919|nr:X-linked retinitis pigmentosa GTPase regulator-like [Pieris rapae]
MIDDIPETGAVFTFGKSHFADNEPSHFFIKNDPIVAISCGDEHSAVICQNGRVFVFGANVWGQLGLGHKDEVTRPSCVKWLKPHRTMFVACGRAHTIFVTDTNAIYSVGCNEEGQLGTGDMESHTVPQFIELTVDQAIRQVSAGSNHTAILTDDGRVFMCGSNTEGQLGLGEDTRTSLKFTELKFMETIAFVECGYYHTVFITAKGAVFVTGDNENQKLGIPDTASTIYVPQVLPLNIEVKSACCGANHTFLLSMDETKILAFGSNEKGQLGMPNTIDYVKEPTEINMDKLFDGFQLKLVACGAMHTAFVTDNGLLYTCGEPRHNKLCLDEIDADTSNDFPNQYSPKRVSAMNGFVVDNVACGGCHTLLTGTKGSNVDFTNNDFIVNQSKPISITELPPLQKIPTMKSDEKMDIEKPTEESNNEDIGSIDSLEANVSGSHIVNINDLETTSMHNVPDLKTEEIDNKVIDVSTSIENEILSTTASIETTIENLIATTDHKSSSIEKGMLEMAEKAEDVKDKAVLEIKSMEDKANEKFENIIHTVKETTNDNIVKVEEVITKTVASIDPGLHDEKKVLEVPDKTELTHSPPPKTPIIQDLLEIPDISHMSPNISKHSDQKSDGDQSENETIPCGSDKSSPQAKTKTQAVMPIVRNEDHIDQEDVVVNKIEEKGRFARMFQSIRDKENSCIGKGKVIEEKITDNVHKGLETAEETVHKLEETVETEIRNQTNSRTCNIL